MAEKKTRCPDCKSQYTSFDDLGMTCFKCGKRFGYLLLRALGVVEPFETR